MFELPEQFCPGGFTFSVGHVNGQDLSMPAFTDPFDDQHGFRDRLAAVRDILILGVGDRIRIALR